MLCLALAAIERRRRLPRPSRFLRRGAGRFRPIGGNSARLRDHILFERVLDDGVTIKTTDGSLLQVVAVPGLDLNARSTEEQDNLFQLRRGWLEGLVEWPRFALNRQQ